MYYYAYIDSNNIVTGVYAMPTEISIAGYIPITADQYTNGNLVGKLYNPETGGFEDVPVWIGSTDDVQYKGTTTSLTSKLDAMDAAIANVETIQGNDVVLRAVYEI